MSGNPVPGSWESSAGSKMSISSINPNGSFSGYFRRPTGEVTQIAGMTSLTSTDGNYPISLAANWPAQGSYYASVTSYTGMYQGTDGHIRVVFLSVDPKVAPYKSVSVDTDVFTRYGNFDDFVKEFGLQGS